jgi:hypothetical protein
MNSAAVLQRITAALDRANIPYMLTGSFASVYYGSPRSTQDIDIVIAPTIPQLHDFIASLPSGEYYAELDDSLQAQKRESMFNVIDRHTGWKIDMIICKSRRFSREELSRRQRVNLEGVPIFVASAEDVILAKLEWSKLSQSQRQIEDAAGILKIRADSLDRPYLERWVRELGLATEWNDAQRMVRIPGLNESDGSN